MAIDPLLYEKVSGRSGDPYSRMGAALAGSDAAKSQRKAAKDETFSSRMTIAHYKYRLIFGGVALVVGLVAMVIVRLFR
jgi:hypothetical protein